MLPYFGACGRLTFVQGPYKPLSQFVKESLPVRVNLASQVLQLIDGFIQDDPNWLLFTRDLSYDNFIVTNANQVFLKDLSHIMLIDRNLFLSEDDNTNNSSDNWTDDKFDDFYEDLVETKNDTKYHEKCSKVFDHAAHMFSLVCKFILSDLEQDLESRRANPLAKSYPGLLHHLEENDEDGKPLFSDVKSIESLITRCSRSPNLDIRHEAALQLLQELIFEDDEGDEDDDLAQEDDEDDEATDDENDKIGEEDLGHDDYEKMQDGPPDGDSNP